MINPTVRALITERIEQLERDLASARDARDRARDNLRYLTGRVEAGGAELAALREQLEPEQETTDVGQCPSITVDEERTAWRCVAERGHQGHHHSAVWTRTW